MASIVVPEEYLHWMGCPGCGYPELAAGRQARCESCHRSFRIADDGLLEFVRFEDLSDPTLREFHANTIDLANFDIGEFVARDQRLLRNSYYGASRQQDIQHLAGFLHQVDHRVIIFLGVGVGREIDLLLATCKPSEIYCSDLTPTRLRVLPRRFAERNVRLALFTADLNRCPLKQTALPVVIVNALHHTEDMHAAIDALLRCGHENIFLVEPTDNLLLRPLAWLGYARRTEYTGVKPGRLDLRRLRKMCRLHGYDATIRTSWAFPGDYLDTIFGRFAPKLYQPTLLLLRVLSAIGRPLRFGNSSAIRLRRLDPPRQ